MDVWDWCLWGTAVCVIFFLQDEIMVQRTKEFIRTVAEHYERYIECRPHADSMDKRSFRRRWGMPVISTLFLPFLEYRYRTFLYVFSLMILGLLCVLARQSLTWWSDIVDASSSAKIASSTVADIVLDSWKLCEDYGLSPMPYTYELGKAVVTSFVMDLALGSKDLIVALREPMSNFQIVFIAYQVAAMLLACFQSARYTLRFASAAHLSIWTAYQIFYYLLTHQSAFTSILQLIAKLWAETHLRTDGVPQLPLDYFTLGDLHENSSWRRQIHDSMFQENMYERAPAHENICGQDVAGLEVEVRNEPLERSEEIMDNTYQDYLNNECWICATGSDNWDLWTPCGHMFCTPCSRSLLEKGMHCPLCGHFGTHEQTDKVIRVPAWDPDAGLEILETDDGLEILETNSISPAHQSQKRQILSGLTIVMVVLVAPYLLSHVIPMIVAWVTVAMTFPLWGSVLLFIRIMMFVCQVSASTRNTMDKVLEVGARAHSEAWGLAAVLVLIVFGSVYVRLMLWKLQVLANGGDVHKVNGTCGWAKSLMTILFTIPLLFFAQSVPIWGMWTYAGRPFEQAPLKEFNSRNLRAYNYCMTDKAVHIFDRALAWLGLV